jgi:nucleotide-binding universal stress UspA family protein
MFTCIVVGTDGSDTADAAVDIAVSLARESGAALHIVNAYRTGSGAGHMAIGGASIPGDESLRRAVSSEASEQLLASASGRATGLNVEIHAVNQAPAKAVIEVAEAVGADLIVVGNKGMERRVFGSVPSAIARETPCNLLIAKTT